MTFAGALLVCWLAIAGLAFLAISGLGRLASRGDVDADLGIVGEAELRMLVGARAEERRAPGGALLMSAAAGERLGWSGLEAWDHGGRIR